MKRQRWIGMHTQNVFWKPVVLLSVALLAGIANTMSAGDPADTTRDGISMTLKADSGSIDVAIAATGSRMEQSRKLPSFAKKLSLGSSAAFTAQASATAAKVTAVVEVWKDGKLVSKVSASGLNVVGSVLNDKPQVAAF